MISSLSKHSSDKQVHKWYNAEFEMLKQKSQASTTDCSHVKQRSHKPPEQRAAMLKQRSHKPPEQRAAMLEMGIRHHIKQMLQKIGQ